MNILIIMAISISVLHVSDLVLHVLDFLLEHDELLPQMVLVFAEVVGVFFDS